MPGAEATAPAVESGITVGPPSPRCPLDLPAGLYGPPLFWGVQSVCPCLYALSDALNR